MEITDSNYGRCLARIVGRGSISNKEAQALLDEITEKSETARLTGESQPIIAAVSEMVGQLKEATENAKLDAMFNASKRIERAGEISQGFSTLKGGINRLKSTLVALAGEQKINVETLWQGLSNHDISILHARLDQAGILKAVKDPSMFEGIAKEISKLRSGEAMIELPNASVERRAAEIIFDSQESFRRRINSEIGRTVIPDVKDWIAQMAHHADLMRNGGRSAPAIMTAKEAFQKWWAFTRDLLDAKTFNDIDIPKGALAADIDKLHEGFAEKVFNSLITGVHDKTATLEGPKFEPGGYNLAKKLAQGRTLFFKEGGEAWSKYMAEYGMHDNWLELTTHQLDRNARRIAQINQWGTNMEANIKLVVNSLKEKFRDKDPDMVNQFASEFEKQGMFRDNIMGMVKLLDGTADKSDNSAAAQIGRAARQVTNMGFLGSVAVTHATSLFATVSSDAMMHGDGIWSSLGKTLRAQFDSLKHPDEQKEFLAQAGAYADSLKRHLQDSFGHGTATLTPEGIPSKVAQGTIGTISSLHDKFMTATGLSYVLEHTKAGRKGMLMESYGRGMAKDFDQLRPEQQSLLQQFKIGADEWKVLKTGTANEYEGKNYLSPDVAQTVDRGAITDLLKSRGTITDKTAPAQIDRLVENFKTDLSDKLTSFYELSAQWSVVTPGVRQRAMIQGTSETGSWRAEMMRSLLQYHAWPIAAMHQIFARQWYDNPSVQKWAWNMGTLVGMSLLGGYIRSAIRDLASGTTPQEPRNMGEATRLGLYWFAQGGGGGILADMLFGELNRSYKAALQSGAPALGGPLTSAGFGLAGMVKDYMKSVGSDKAPDGNYWAHIVRELAPHVPFANLVYLKTAYDYLFMWHLFESMKPGWWERTNRTMQQETGRTRAGYGTWYRP